MIRFVLRRISEGLFAAGLVLGATRCAPEFTFQDGTEASTPDEPGEPGEPSTPAEPGGPTEPVGHCENERQDRDQGELDVDCGGADCAPCPIECPQGSAECDGVLEELCETNVLLDAQHCGSCTTRCELPGTSAVSCSAGLCQVDACAAPFANCNSRSDDGCEVNLTIDAVNCGACGSVCPSLHSTPSCLNGACRIDACDAGWADCNGDPADGCERPTSSDTLNCGVCGKECPSTPTATAFCREGTCGATSCESGLGDCNGDGVCERDLRSDPMNCGRCGNPCGVANGVGACVDGECVLERCDPGFDNCDEDRDDGGFANGCETNLLESQDHCGECGRACTIRNAVADCSNGLCRVSSCVAPFGDCNKDGTSCETDTSENTSHCGSCGNDCSANFARGNANGVCEESQCSFDGCRTGFLDCNGDELSCEANPRTDRAHCGACGVLCATGPGTSANRCVNAECEPTCRPGSGYDDCDTDRANGCETNTQSTTQHCGECGIRCSTDGASMTRCMSGTCRPTCSAGRGNCDGDGQNGCETLLTNDPANCGECGVTCSLEGATRSRCQPGSSPTSARCVPDCDETHGNCDNDGQNGCEVDLTEDAANCGGCGTLCSAQGTSSTGCRDSVCVPVCDPTHADCDTSRVNGCETALGTAMNCAACGDACGAGEICNAGTCEQPPRIAILSNTSGGSAGGLLNLSLNLAAGQNRLLLVAVVSRGVANGGSLLAQATPDSVSFAGRAMRLFTQYGPSSTQPKTDGHAYVFYYSLNEADLAALGAGAKPLAVSGIIAQPFPNALAADAILFSNVNQTSPLSNQAGAFQPPGSSACAPSLNVTLTRVGSVIHGIGAIQYGPVATPSPISLTKTLDYSFPQVSSGSVTMWVGGFHFGVSSETELAPASYPVGFSSSCSDWVFSTLVINRQ